MGKRIYLNDVTATLAAALTAGATSASLQTGDGAQFNTIPAGDWIVAHLIKMSGYKEVAKEIVHITARSTDTLTIARAKESTTALDFAAGDKVAVRLTKTLFDNPPIVGTTTNDDAPTGQVGEYLSASTVFSSPVALTSGAYSNVASLTLSAGDWDVSGVMGYVFGATTSLTQLRFGLTTTSAGAPVDTGGGGVQGGGLCGDIYAAFVPNAGIRKALPPVRVKLAASTTIYFVAQAVFTVSTCSAFAELHARRVR